METNVHYSLVGIFVIGLIAAIVFGIIWLSSGLAYGRFSTYLVYMQDSVTGLNVDSPVEFNGVEVGQVKQIQLNKKNPRLVKVYLNINNDTPVTRGTVAMIATRGLTGITFIGLKDQGTDTRPLVAVKGQRYPVIPSAPSIFTRIETALGELTKSFKTISKTFSSVFDQQNQLSIKETLINLREVTSTLAGSSQQLQSIIDNTSRASRQLTPLMQSGTQTFKTFEKQTLPEVQRLLNNLNEVTRSLNQMSIEIKQNPSVLIRGIERQPGPGESR